MFRRREARETRGLAERRPCTPAASAARGPAPPPGKRRATVRAASPATSGSPSSGPDAAATACGSAAETSPRPAIRRSAPSIRVWVRGEHRQVRLTAERRRGDDGRGECCGAARRPLAPASASTGSPAASGTASSSRALRASAPSDLLDGETGAPLVDHDDLGGADVRDAPAGATPVPTTIAGTRARAARRSVGDVDGARARPSSDADEQPRSPRRRRRGRARAGRPGARRGDELGSPGPRHGDRPSRPVACSRASRTSPTISRRSTGNCITKPRRRARPRAWIACRTPTARRFATIDEPPTVTNGSGMPVTGATPIVIPTFTNTWKANATTMPPATIAP